MVWFTDIAKHELPWASPPPRFDQKNKFIVHTSTGRLQGAINWWTSQGKGYNSTFYVELDGSLTQFCDSNSFALANGSANSSGISIEGADHGPSVKWIWDPYTVPQIDSILRLIKMCVKVHPKILLQRVTSPEGAGIGYHSMYKGGIWTKDHVCPGPARVAQFNLVIMPLLLGQALRPGVTKDLGGYRGLMAGDEIARLREVIGDGPWVQDILKSQGTLNPRNEGGGSTKRSTKKKTTPTTRRRQTTTPRAQTHRTKTAKRNVKRVGRASR